MSIYHNVFTKNAFDTPEKIELLKRYIYTGEPVSAQISEIKTEEVPIIIEKKEVPASVFYPDKKDTLFWCIFVANNGMAEYESIGRGYSNIEIDEKHKITNYIKGQPNRLKNTNHKITNVVIQEIMSDVLTNNMLNVQSLLALAVFYKKRIILTKGNKFYIDICPTDEVVGTIVLLKNDKGEYGLGTNDMIDKIESEQFCMQKYDRPLNAVSNLSIDELKQISNKVGFEMKGKYTKPVLYQELTRYCLW